MGCMGGHVCRAWVWDESGDVQYRHGGLLMVRAPASTQAKIEKLVRDLDAAASRRVKLQVRVVDLNEGEYEEIAAGRASELDLSARTPLASFINRWCSNDVPEPDFAY